MKVHADGRQIEPYFDDLLGNGALSRSSGKFHNATSQRQATINGQKKKRGGGALVQIIGLIHLPDTVWQPTNGC